MAGFVPKMFQSEQNCSKAERLPISLRVVGYGRLNTVTGGYRPISDFSGYRAKTKSFFMKRKAGKAVFTYSCLWERAW
jgi:hypothetical protein